MKTQTFKLIFTYDNNGNKIVKVSIPGFRSFSIQTNGNLHETHRNGLFAGTALEVKNWVKQYGTEKQKDAVNFIV